MTRNSVFSAAMFLCESLEPSVLLSHIFGLMTARVPPVTTCSEALIRWLGCAPRM